MIPWIESQVFYIGPVPFRTWGTLVALGFVVGAWISARRATKKGFDKKIVWEWSFWYLLIALIGARIFHVLFYNLSYYLEHSFEIIDPRQQGFAIFGAFIACALVTFWLVRKNNFDFLKISDVFIWGLPWGIFIGRLGCFLIHDHPGIASTFFLAVRYPDGIARHDLGLYLSLTGLIAGLIFLLLDRKSKPDGTFLATYMLMEGLSRLWLDFYRIVDVRYFGLTPAQWLSFLLIGCSIWIFFIINRKTSIQTGSNDRLQVA
ncbi:MAG: prolipoprotein diacylglyceryl transferase family protein [Patescibacteria group bacterium]